MKNEYIFHCSVLSTWLFLNICLELNILTKTIVSTLDSYLCQNFFESIAFLINKIMEFLEKFFIQTEVVVRELVSVTWWLHHFFLHFSIYEGNSRKIRPWSLNESVSLWVIYTLQFYPRRIMTSLNPREPIYRAFWPCFDNFTCQAPSQVRERSRSQCARSAAKPNIWFTALMPPFRLVKSLLPSPYYPVLPYLTFNGPIFHIYLTHKVFSWMK